MSWYHACFGPSIGIFICVRRIYDFYKNVPLLFRKKNAPSWDFFYFHNYLQISSSKEISENLFSIIHYNFLKKPLNEFITIN